MTDSNELPEYEENEEEQEEEKQTTKEAGRGPASRVEAAIAERFATRHPKDEEPDEPGMAMADDVHPEDLESPAPSDTRRRMIDEYRQRQSEQVQEERGLPPSLLAIGEEEEEEEDAAEDDEPSLPQPPVPPPANNWIPIGPRQSWNFGLNIKADILQDAKLEKKRDFRDRF